MHKSWCCHCCCCLQARNAQLTMGPRDQSRHVWNTMPQAALSEHCLAKSGIPAVHEYTALVSTAKQASWFLKLCWIARIGSVVLPLLSAQTSSACISIKPLSDTVLYTYIPHWAVLQACNNTNPCPINCTGAWQVTNANNCTGAW